MDPTYLGHPAPTPTSRKPQGVMSKKTLFIVLALVGALIVGGIMLMSSGDKSGPLQQRLSARHAATLTVITDGQKNIQNDELSKLNSELKIVLLGDIQTFDATVSTLGKKQKPNKTIVADEANKTSLEKLKDAKLNAQYDTTYEGLLTQKLESLRALVTELHDNTSYKRLKAVLATEYAHLTTYINALTELQ